jgi:hypothetical protein
VNCLTGSYILLGTSIPLSVINCTWRLTSLCMNVSSSAPLQGHGLATLRQICRQWETFLEPVILIVCMQESYVNFCVLYRQLSEYYPSSDECTLLWGRAHPLKQASHTP